MTRLGAGLVCLSMLVVCGVHGAALALPMGGPDLPTLLTGIAAIVAAIAAIIEARQPGIEAQILHDHERRITALENTQHTHEIADT